MIKYIMVAVLALTAATAAARGSSHPADSTGMTNIIPKDVGFYQFNNFAMDGAGRLILCPGNASHDGYNQTCTISGKNAWQLPEQFVPKGRTYIGYQPILYSGKVYRVMIFWK